MMRSQISAPLARALKCRGFFNAWIDVRKKRARVVLGFPRLLGLSQSLAARALQKSSFRFLPFGFRFLLSF
jgi:hypothetical protein